MSLGTSMANTFPDEKRFVIGMLVLFACFTPLGVILGMIIGASSDMAEIVCSCLAAGTFVYISCSEVIVEEFSLSKYKYIKLFAYAIGVALISSLHFLE